MPRTIIVFVSILIALFCCRGYANNNFFLPGDAFYYSEPNHEWFESLASLEKPVALYQRPRKGAGGRFCGYAGYNKLRLDNLTPEMRSNLLKAYRQLRARYPQRVETYQESTLKMVNGKLVPIGPQKSSQVEFNLVSMLIYNRDFDLGKFRPLFRYNENWADAAAAFGHARDGVAYDFFVDDKQSITNDWRDSALVDPLKVSIPNKKTTLGRAENVVISIDCKDIQILLFPTTYYEDIAFPEERVELQDVAGNRAAVSTQKSAGGVFAIQDSVEESVDHDGEDKNEAAPTETKMPFFGYRAFQNGVEVLRPKKGRWVVSQRLLTE